MKNKCCIACGLDHLPKNTIGINKKLLGDKIDEFKEQGCKLFE